MTTGLSIGIRHSFGKDRDLDGDGIPDKKDICPFMPGLAKFSGCPDTDGDGIPDYEDSCRTKSGLLRFHGCPDSDGDGLQDKDDDCPEQAGPVLLHGCPDKDSDGIPDKDDRCPRFAGPVIFHGCPDTDGDGVPDIDDKCPSEAGYVANSGCPTAPRKEIPGHYNEESTEYIAPPILFDLNRIIIKEAALPILQEVVDRALQEKNATITVDVYTDATGTDSTNRVLSIERAKAVRTQLMKMGLSPRRVKVAGHGAEAPLTNNDTNRGRKQNRRAVIKIKKQ